jgi:glutathione S-transferase
MKKIDDSLIAMDRALAERSNCVGIHLSLADIAVGVAVGYLDFRFPQIDWRGKHPNLAALYERLSQRQSFKESLPT